jgi:hypothetical protein
MTIDDDQDAIQDEDDLRRIEDQDAIEEELRRIDEDDDYAFED